MYTQTYLDVFFNYYDAIDWVESHMDDHSEFDWETIDLEIKLLDSGAYRAGVTFKRKQMELDFG
jgi:hypothetical protein